MTEPTTDVPHGGLSSVHLPEPEPSSGPGPTDITLSASPAPNLKQPGPGTAGMVVLRRLDTAHEIVPGMCRRGLLKLFRKIGVPIIRATDGDILYNEATLIKALHGATRQNSTVITYPRYESKAQEQASGRTA